MTHGIDKNLFAKFDQVFSGHYHTKSSHANCHYLGNPYHIYWNDWGDEEGSMSTIRPQRRNS